ncbi:MAG TPA: glycosyltransferase family 39 protein [Flavobacteriales bacterium]|nr:glycosyltransferase family 39 protein [Flavobacteriales bacterium]
MNALRRLYRILGGRWLFIAGFALFCALYEYGRVLHLRPLPMHIWRQGDCLSLTWNYYTGEATFGSPVVHARIADGGSSGKSAGEFPILYWTMGQIWKVTGPSEFVYRAFGLLFHFLASYLLFLTLRRILKSDFWSIGVALLLFTSPVLLYYSIGFLTDVPAFDLALIGWYFFVRHAEDGSKRWWVLAIFSFTLATLLKVTAGMSLVALLALFALATLRPSLLGELRKAFPAAGFGWAVVALALSGVAAWYVHAERFNNLHNGRYTFNNLWPIWEMNTEEIDRAVNFAKTILVFQIFDTSVLVVIGLAIVLLLLHVRQLPLPVALLNGMLLLGTIIYTLCWFHAVDGHDYYFINPIITLLVPLVTWLWWLRRTHPEIFNARWVRWAFILFLGYNAAYARNNLIMRSNPTSQMDRKDLLPTYHCEEPAFWNSMVNPVWEPLWTIAPYLRSIGVQPQDLVMSPDDYTINTSLYLMHQPGFTEYGYNMEEAATFERCISLGAQYVVVVDERWLNKEVLQPYFTRPIGQHGRARVYDLLHRETRVDTAFVYRQMAGVPIPVLHRSNATVCEGSNGWCFASDAFPLEIDGLPLEANGLRYADVEVRGTIHWEGGYSGGGILALAENDSTGQLGQLNKDLPEGPFALEFRVPARTKGVHRKLYFWNTTGSSFRLEGLEVVVKHHLAVP